MPKPANIESSTTTFSGPWPARVASVLDDNRIVINRGKADGVKLNARFFIYGLSLEPVKDPETGNDLGHVEIPRGIGGAIHVQDHLAVLISLTPRRSTVKSPFGRLINPFPLEQTVTLFPDPNDHVPFQDVKVNDLVRPENTQ